MNKFKTSNPTFHDLLLAKAEITLENGVMVHYNTPSFEFYRHFAIPNPTLFDILEARAKVMFHDGSGIEYAEYEGKRYIKAIGPGGKSFMYTFDLVSIHTILAELDHLTAV